MAGVRSLLAYWLGGASSTPPVLVPDAAAPRHVTVTAFDSFGGQVMGQWAGLASASITFNKNGSETANISVVTRMPDGEANPCLRFGRSAPGNRGALVQIDPRAIGYPEVWMGMLNDIPEGNNVPVSGVSAQGPHAWLATESVAGAGEITASTGRIVRALFESTTAPLWVRVGSAHGGPRVSVDMTGGMVWDVLAELEAETLGCARLTAVPGQPLLILDWVDQLAAKFHESGRLVLVEDVNCNWSATANLVPGPDQLLLTGRRLNDHTESNSAVARAPAGNVLGRYAALSAAVTVQSAAGYSGAGGAAMRPDIGGLPQLKSQVAASVRSGLTPVLMCNVEVTDPSLWPLCVAGTLCETRFPSSATGVWAKAVAEIQQVSIDVLPTQKLTMAIELWAVLE